MQIKYFDTTATLINSVSEIILSDFKSKKRRLKIFFPAGKTPYELYLAFSRDPETWSEVFEVLQVDEFQGQPIFSSELKELVVEPLGLENHFKSINCNWTVSQMMEHIHSIVNNGIDGAMLGMGPNGHIGFHEPGDLDEHFLGGALEIAEASRVRVEGAKSNKVYTFGAGAFLKADYVILIIKGQNKKKALERFLQEPSSSQMPATLLKNHPRLYVFVDKNLT